MSYISFTSPSGVVRLPGRERAYAGLLIRRLAAHTTLSAFTLATPEVG